MQGIWNEDEEKKVDEGKAGRRRQEDGLGARVITSFEDRPSVAFVGNMF